MNMPDEYYTICKDHQVETRHCHTICSHCRIQKFSPVLEYVNGKFPDLYEDVSKSFRTGRLQRELKMVQLSATRCRCVTILWVSLENSAAITLCVSSQLVIPKVSIYFVIDSVRKLLDTPSYMATYYCLDSEFMNATMDWAYYSYSGQPALRTTKRRRNDNTKMDLVRMGDRQNGLKIVSSLVWLITLSKLHRLHGIQLDHECK
jgi:hypothetical protein